MVMDSHTHSAKECGKCCLGSSHISRNPDKAIHITHTHCCTHLKRLEMKAEMMVASGKQKLAGDGDGASIKEMWQM